VTGTLEADGAARLDSAATFNSDLIAKTGGTATFMVAANDASDRVKNQADYVADSTADDVQIQAAIDALPAGSGKVVLSGWTFNVAAPIAMVSGLHLLGMDTTTIKLTNTTNTNLIEAISINRIMLSDMILDRNRTNQTTNVDNVDWNTGALGPDTFMREGGCT
jgi:hypothetical protein